MKYITLQYSTVQYGFVTDQVDGEDGEEAAGPRRVHRVARVVGVRPRVGSDHEIFLSINIVRIFHFIRIFMCRF